MASEVEALCEVDHAVLVFRVLEEISVVLDVERHQRLTHSRSFWRILTSTNAC
jgi:hypothetical protein